MTIVRGRGKGGTRCKKGCVVLKSQVTTTRIGKEMKYEIGRGALWAPYSQ